MKLLINAFHTEIENHQFFPITDFITSEFHFASGHIPVNSSKGLRVSTQFSKCLHYTA